MGLFRKAYLLLAAASFAALLPSIAAHFEWMLGGQALPNILRDRWDIALVNIAFFGAFVLLTGYRRRVNWRSKGVYTAFIAALFAEMYGFPLTAYFMAKYVGTVPVDYHPLYSLDISFMGVVFTLPTMMLVGGFITVAGLTLVAAGWYQVYRSRGAAVTGGLYRYSRHPQYVGFLLVTFGWLIHWPTILTLLMWPYLAVVYYRLAREEEEYVMGLYPAEYGLYRERTPMFL